MEGGDLEPAGVGAVAVVEEVEVGAAGGCGLLGGESAALFEVGGVGVDDLEHPPPEHLQGLLVVGLGQSDQVLLGHLRDSRLDGVGQCLDGVDDDAGLCGVEEAGGEGVAGGGAGSVELVGEPYLGACR